MILSQTSVASVLAILSAIALSFPAVAETQSMLWLPLDQEPSCRAGIDLPPDAKDVGLDQSQDVRATWTGRCQDGLISGSGTLTLSETFTTLSFVGKFVGGVLRGEGEATLSTGSPDNVHRVVYKGRFLEGVLNGTGELKHGLYKYYRGEFQNWLPNGEGVLVHQPGWVSKGVFEDGNLVSGTVMFPDGGRMEGTFSVGKLNGSGRVVLPDGTFVEGEFLDSEIKGDGAKVFPDGSRYDGTFKRGQEHGVGTFKFASGNECSGEWEEGRLIGEGGGTYDGKAVKCWQREDGDIVFAPQ